MSEHQVILDDGFWKFLVSLEELVEKKDKALFCSSLAIDDETLLIYQQFLNRFHIECQIDENYIYPLKEKVRFKLELTLAEWMALQAMMHTQEKSNYFHRIVQNKMLLAQRAHELYDLFKKPPHLGAHANEEDNLKKKVDYSICCKKSLRLSFHNEKECEIFPHRLVFLDGILCVVGESIKDKTLAYFGLEDIKLADEHNEYYEPNLSQLEISDFITHLRLINGKEERLILKIYNQYETDLLPSYHYLENPFVTSNNEGDMIWAATIEMCEDVFMWLYNMRDRVEVLDPGHIRKEFAHFCELKKVDPGIKKAS